jgi:CDP-diacylglycerol--serine O-phosphatidyltransferase
MAMIRFLRDPANSITAFGLVCCAIGLYLALQGHPALATAAVVWAWIADHLDGIVARRTREQRSPEVAQFGKNFDGFADFIHGILFPSVVLVQIAGTSPLTFPAVLALMLLGPTRLAYFGTFGLAADGRTTGIPVTYNLPLLTVLVFLRPAVPPEIFPHLAAAAFLLLAGLHVTPAARVPPIQEATFPFAAVFGGAASLALAFTPRL